MFSPNYIDLESRIKSMDETGISAQVLSLMAPMVYWAPPAFGLKLAQSYNDACSAAHRATAPCRDGDNGRAGRNPAGQVFWWSFSLDS